MLHHEVGPLRITLTVLLALTAHRTGCGALPPLREPLMHRDGATEPQFLLTMDGLLGPPLVHGNQVQALVNGDAILPAMLDIDEIGASEIDPASITAMREAGAQVIIHRPLDLFTLDRVNDRTHRTLLVVDGRIGFIGGAGIADAWLGNAEDAARTRVSACLLTADLSF